MSVYLAMVEVVVLVVFRTEERRHETKGCAMYETFSTASLLSLCTMG